MLLEIATTTLTNVKDELLESEGLIKGIDRRMETGGT